MEIIKYSQYREKSDIIKMWNNEYGFIFPITEDLFERNVKNAYDDATLVAVINDEAVGFIVGKIWQDNYEINTYQQMGWISLIFVKPAYRKQGIGTKLLEQVESEFKLLGKTIINVGKDYNNFFPGLPTDLKSSLEWFTKKGYESPYDTFDLICKNKDLIPLKNNQFIFRPATLFDREAITAFMLNNWPGRWAKEMEDYWNNKGTGKEYLICLDNNKVIAFVKINYPNTPISLISYNETWRARFEALGGIGPLGVDKAYRGHQLGHDIVAFAKNTLIDSHVSDIIIDWTGILDFYHKFGFEVWKSYYYLKKGE